MAIIRFRSIALLSASGVLVILVMISHSGWIQSTTLPKLKSLSSSKNHLIQLEAVIDEQRGLGLLGKSYSPIPPVEISSELPPPPSPSTGTLNANEARIRIAAVSCGLKKIEETMTMVKSAIISGIRFKLPSLEIHIFADNETLSLLESRLNEMKDKINGKSGLSLRFQIHPVILSTNPELNNWPKAMPCTTQRLMFSTMASLSNVTTLLYVDADVIFLKDLREIWSYFSKMNASQHTGLVPEHQTGTDAWYGQISKTPFYPPFGLNAGVMLMNLTGQRESGWEDLVTKYHRKYKADILLADQDVLNIIFHFHPETVSILPCAFNYRHAHCYRTKNTCPSAETSGVHVIHGNSYPNHFSPPAFKTVYTAFEKFDLSKDDIRKDLFEPLYKDLMRLDSYAQGDCSHLVQFFPKF